MKRHLPLVLALIAAIAGTLAVAAVHADEGSAEFDISPKFRAKIAKEKAKQAARQSSTSNGTQNGGGPEGEPQCGAQNIGTVDTNGRTGNAPREVFVFAPNAINLVSNGCN
jgi:hypothetical protein